MKFLDRLKKKRQCFYCNSMTKPDVAYTIEVQTANGVIKKTVCPNCAGRLNHMIDLWDDLKDGK